MKKIFITGVAGFIGSNLAKDLLNKNFEIVGIDDLSIGNTLNLQDIFNNEKFTFVEGSILDKDLVMKTAEPCDIIYHLAANKIPRYTDALNTLKVNAEGSANVFETAIKSKKLTIFASTSDVYGKNNNIPFSETTNLVVGNPEVKRWAYAISKMYEEQLAFAYHDRYEIPMVGIRFFGSYGPNQTLSFLGGPPPVFIDKAIQDETIEIHGDGKQTRSFTYIDDHINGLTNILKLKDIKKEIFNLGNTHEISIVDLAKLIWTLIRGNKTEPKIKFIPYSSFGKYEDVMRRVPNIEKAKSLLNFEPKFDLESGLRETIKWQIKRYDLLKNPVKYYPSWLNQ